MGGKKKTKWRKLPLEEFTKTVPSKSEKNSHENETIQRDPALEESNYNSSMYNETSENVQYYTEPYEYIDGIYYPTSCVVYSSADAAMYPNYMIPVDNCYYYTVPPEVAQLQEYAPMPYPEYCPALPKNTVYLLLPSQSLRPPQPVSSGPEWQNRRRRRRYEGYAEYAVIPEKSHLADVKETESKIDNVSYRRSSQPSNTKINNSLSETNNSVNYSLVTENHLTHSTSSNPKGSTASNSISSKEKDLNFVSKTMDSIESKTHRKNSKICGIHTKHGVNINDQEIPDDNLTKISISKKDFSLLNTDNSTTDKVKSDDSQTSKCINTKSCAEKENHQITDCKDTLYSVDFIPNIPSEVEVKLCKSSDQEINKKIESNVNSENLNKSANVSNIKPGNVHENTEPSTLLDVLSTINKQSLSNTIAETDTITNSNISDTQMSPKAKSFLSQTTFLPNLFNSEALNNEVESELRHLQNLQSLQANQSIYKLAFDESITDQSEADSRSPSPVDPESQIPSSLTNNEIMIHEADSGSEAGSEDVELIPHRYESETFLSENKHVYVNKLSLAVELLRTQESLPYDEEFKRVVTDNHKIVPVHNSGSGNIRLVDDSNVVKQNISYSNERSDIVNLNQTKHSAHSSNDSAIFSDIEFDSLDVDELCESAKEDDVQSGENQEMSEGIRIGYRRLGTQARYLSQRTTFSLNPCFCCTIM